MMATKSLEEDSLSGIEPRENVDHGAFMLSGDAHPESVRFEVNSGKLHQLDFFYSITDNNKTIELVDRNTFERHGDSNGPDRR